MNSQNFSVVLFNPDIPQNTGNIGRMCVVSGCELVLIRPLGFRLHDKFLLRAGMDYWNQLPLIILDSVEEFFQWAKEKRVFFLSAHGKKNYAEIAYRTRDVFCLGSESTGLPKEILAEALRNDTSVTLPMVDGARCLNVSSAASIIVYEALRQINGWAPQEKS